MMDSTQRFSNRVADYVRYRPGYPADVLRVLEADAGLNSSADIADVGSGTGISTKLFLDHGNTVYGVEPNRDMRQAAEQLLAGNTQFHSVDGTAEKTTLADGSIDFVVAGQAFHWFNRPQTRQEFVRILRPGGWVVLMWNNRRIDSTPFLREYENTINEFAVDYRQVDHKNVDDAAIREFFAPAAFQIRSLPNHQSMDLSGLIGRIDSSSYMPTKDDPRYPAMVQALENLFAKHQQAGQVKIEYDTVMYFGQLA